MTCVWKSLAFSIQFTMILSNTATIWSDSLPVEEPLQEVIHEEGLDTAVQHPAKVILFNDEEHTFDEVIGQLIKALRCDLPKAEALTWEVHHTGKAMVYEGEMVRCVQISSVLEEIELLTQIEV